MNREEVPWLWISTGCGEYVKHMPWKRRCFVPHTVQQMDTKPTPAHVADALRLNISRLQTPCGTCDHLRKPSSYIIREKKFTRHWNCGVSPLMFYVCQSRVCFGTPWQGFGRIPYELVIVGIIFVCQTGAADYFCLWSFPGNFPTIIGAFVYFVACGFGKKCHVTLWSQ